MFWSQKFAWTIYYNLWIGDERVVDPSAADTPKPLSMSYRNNRENHQGFVLIH